MLSHAFLLLTRSPGHTASQFKNDGRKTQSVWTLHNTVSCVHADLHLSRCTRSVAITSSRWPLTTSGHTTHKKGVPYSTWRTPINSDRLSLVFTQQSVSLAAASAPTSWSKHLSPDGFTPRSMAGKWMPHHQATCMSLHLWLSGAHWTACLSFIPKLVLDFTSRRATPFVPSLAPCPSRGPAS